MFFNVCTRTIGKNLVHTLKNMGRPGYEASRMILFLVILTALVLYLIQNLICYYF